MSYDTWHNYGYGICVDDIKNTSLERLQQLIRCAPGCEESITGWLAECGIEQPTYDDYMEYDQDYYLGLATILYEVIEEVEGVTFLPCDNFNSSRFLIYPPSYPWTMPEKEKTLTEEKLAEILRKYINILTDEEIVIDYCSVENGG